MSTATQLIGAISFILIAVLFTIRLEQYRREMKNQDTAIILQGIWAGYLLGIILDKWF